MSYRRSVIYVLLPLLYALGHGLVWVLTVLS